MIMVKTSKYMEGFFKQYRKWGTIALCCVVTLLFTITAIDSFVGFAFSKNMYMMSIVATACLLAIISMSWIRILNCKLMRPDLEETLKTTVQSPQFSPITLKDIDMCIRKEGYIPQVEEDRIVFKITGERYDVYYQDEKFTLVKRFAISDDIDRNLLLKACTQALDEIFMFRCYTHCYDDKTTLLCFEVETYVNSLKELERFFPQYLNVINHAIERQREIYYQMLADSKQHEMGSVTTTAKELKVVS